MNYLLVNHVPFALGSSPALVRGVEAVVRDFAAQAAALAEIGMRMMVAAPVVPARHPAARRCDSVEFAPDDAGFELLHLPVYQSMRDYLRVKKNLAAALRRHIALADIVQLGYGGHPMMLGEVAWPIAAAANRRRIWMFDANDPFAHRTTATKRGAVRRVLRDRLVGHKIRFCRRAVAQADLVFAHHPSIAGRFERSWNDRCHQIDTPLFDVDDLPSESALGQRFEQRADKSAPIRLASFAPHDPADPADHLIRAFAHCRRLSVPVELLLIAPEPAVAGMMKLAGELAMDRYIRRADRPDDLGSLLRVLDRCDALVSIDRDGMDQRGLFAAMARGLPVVAYENPATDRLIESAEAGLVVPGNNVLLLAQAIIDLHRNRLLLNRLGESAWRCAATRTRQFTHRRRAAIIGELIGQVAEQVR